MKTYDIPTFPGNGIIYTGDYYLDIPYQKYIYEEEIPSGPVFDIRSYGATAEAGVLSTEAIQKATGCKRLSTGESTETEYCKRKVKIWRMPSTSRAYPLPFLQKAEYYSKIV